MEQETQKEFEQRQRAEELQAKLDKQEAQCNMAWTSLTAMLIVTGLLFTPFISAEKIETIIPMLDWFYIAQASIVGAFMGMTAWMSKK